jgi:hypothetical protein
MSYLVIENEAKQFIASNTFLPHKDGNSMNYGLNSFGCDSIIKYNNDIWKFIWFITGTNKAVYINKAGEIFIYNNQDLDITRMEIIST